MNIAAGPKVSLRRALPADRARAYRWLVESDLTPAQMGPPLMADRAVPDFARFCADYGSHCFDCSAPFEGRGFVVTVGAEDVGFLHHGPVNLLKDVVELDLWLAAAGHQGRGYGSEALRLACDWLQASLGVNRFLLRPSRRNVHALRAIRRAGFRETDLQPQDVIRKLGLPRGAYLDEVLMFRILKLPVPRLAPDPGRLYVFVDSEFTRLEQPQLISVGAVATDDSAFYCELSDWPPEDCSPFVRSTVLPLLERDAVPHDAAAASFAEWLARRARLRPVTLVSDSGFDRWAVADLLGTEELPAGVHWQRLPIAYETLDETARSLGLRRHHALDDARALRHLVLNPTH